jgi:hypothetical protein
MERGRERFGGKMVLGQKMSIEEEDAGFKIRFIFLFFFKKKNAKTEMTLST